MAKVKLEIFKTHSSVKIPKFQTEQSACFDLAYNRAGNVEYSGFDSFNAPFKRVFGTGNEIKFAPGDRIMVPTGIIFKIPEGYSVRIHPRSGLSLKQGLVLSNQEGVVDSDYFHEIHVLLTNATQIKQIIREGDRIAQAELVKSSDYDLAETIIKPEQTTSRAGGYGSTGVQ